MRLILKKICSTRNCIVSNISRVRHYSNDAPKVEDRIKKNLIIEKYGGIFTINIDRQASKNSLDLETLQELSAAIDEFDKDDNQKVLILHGEGGTFCSGFDLDALVDNGLNCMVDAAMRLRKRPICAKVTIAAVPGYAVAEGFELALACDLRIVEDTTMIGCLARRFGVPQNLHGTARLTALIGLAPALDLMMTGRLITGAEAYQRGLATKLTSTGTALGEAVKLAKSITKFPQAALMVDKMTAINSTMNPNSDEFAHNEAVIMSKLGQAVEDVKNGVPKFQDGIGRHGKFYKLTEVPLKDWELEDSFTETTVWNTPPFPSSEKK